MCEHEQHQPRSTVRGYRLRRRLNENATSKRVRHGTLLLAIALVTVATAPEASENGMPAPMRGTAGVQSPAAAPAPAPTPWVRGKVLETMDAGNYTYVHIDTGSGKKWAAGPRTAVKVGDEIAFPGGALEMPNFESKSLGRRFESIAFVGALVVGDPPAAGKAAATDPHAGIPGMAGGGDPHAGVAGVPPKSAPHGAPSGSSEPQIDTKNIARANGGYTVGEIHDKRSELEAKEISVRGKVVKFNAGVMSRNWIHLRDGSAGQAGANDLTVTTDDRAQVGDTVVVKGRVGVNRDFGFGYRYDVMLESATVDVEK